MKPGTDKFGAQSITAVNSTLGVAATEDEAGTAVVVNVEKGITADITATAANKLENVAITNEGKLTFKGNTVELAAVDLSKNNGVVTFKGASTVTGSIVNGGKTVFDGDFELANTSDASFQTAKAVMAATGEADTLFTGNVSVQGADADKLGTFTADSLTINQASKTFAVKDHGVVNVGAVEVKDGTFHNEAGVANIDSMKVGSAGTVTLAGTTKVKGQLAVEEGITSESTGTTTVGELIVGKTNATGNSTFTISDGNFTADSVKVLETGHTATLAISGTAETSLVNVDVAKGGVLTIAATTENTINSLTAQDGSNGDCHKFCVHGIIGARHTGTPHEHDYQETNLS